MMVDQYLRERKAATPPLIQVSSISFEGSSMYITKLVEWPVVDSVPLLDSTLYNGQLYIPSFGGFLSAIGTSCIKGRSENSSLGYGLFM
jgi:hypothetical protein